MKPSRHLFFYVVSIVVFVLMVWFVIDKGNQLASLDISSIHLKSPTVQPEQPFTQQVFKTITKPISLLILQMIAIMVAAKVFGYLFLKVRQPSVIGEIVAGIFLGPSALGLFFPEAYAFLFPTSSIIIIQMLSQLGLALFMFIIGMELDFGLLKGKKQSTLIISHVSIIFPYLLGVVLAYFLFTSFAPPNITFISFALFMGIAMSITAFPVLARIIRDRNMTKTTLGSMALTCAAADDVTAWCILALVVAIAKSGTGWSAIYTFLCAGAFILCMFYVVRPLLAKATERLIRNDKPTKSYLSIVFLMLLAALFIAEIIGIHLLFGAFIAGVIMPEKIDLKNRIVYKVEDVSLVLLLPLFFIYTGLRTEIGLLNSLHLWLVCALIIFLAVLGKFAGTALTARYVGHKWQDAMSLGVLMNTRGLMELIVLNIGYDLGILSKEIFSMMVIMALVTTFMTGPALDFINKIYSGDSRVKDTARKT